MGKPTGFMEYQREEAPAFSVYERIKNFDEFHEPLSREEQQKQGARCMECGVPFCQSGMMLGGMISGCPLNNLISPTTSPSSPPAFVRLSVKRHAPAARTATR